MKSNDDLKKLFEENWVDQHVELLLTSEAKETLFTPTPKTDMTSRVVTMVTGMSEATTRPVLNPSKSSITSRTTTMAWNRLLTKSLTDCSTT